MIDRETAERAIEECGGNLSAVARTLGLSYMQAMYAARQYQLLELAAQLRDANGVSGKRTMLPYGCADAEGLKVQVAAALVAAGNEKHAATLLGWSRSRLQRARARLGIENPNSR